VPQDVRLEGLEFILALRLCIGAVEGALVLPLKSPAGAVPKTVCRTSQFIF
jgi:hypothetical protein